MRAVCDMNRKGMLFLLVFFLTFTLPGMATGPFRFVVLSDVHINVLTPSATEDLRSSVQQINATDSIDFVLVTGDIADEGDGASLTVAKQELDKLKQPYYIILGNHDTKWSESGVTDFKRIFGYERFKFEYKGFIFIGFNTGPIIRMALGHVAPEDLDWIKQELEYNGTNGKPVFLVTHYPMLQGDVDNWYEVTDEVRNYPIEAFIGGHYHVNKYMEYEGIRGIINRSSLRDKSKVSGYNEYDITSDSILVYEHKVGQPRHRWLSLPLLQNFSAAQGKQWPRPDFSMNDRYKEVTEQWTTESRVGIYGSPACDKKFVYTGDNLGNVICYSADKGFEQWRYVCGGRILGTPAVGDGVVVAGSADNRIVGVNAKTGKLMWSVKTEAPVLGAVNIVKGIAYVGASDHIFRAIDVKDGRIVWSYNGVKGYVETMPLVTKDKVIFGAWDNTLYALDRTSGAEVWKWQGGHPGMHYSPAAVWPVAAHGKVFIADPERALTAIDINTGKTVWRTKQSMVRETIGLSKDKSRIYSKTMNDSVVCYSAKDDTPREIWAANVGFGYEHAPSMQVEKQGVVFGSTKEGLIYALDAKTGKVYWIHKIANTLINTVVPMSRSRIYFTNSNGTVGELEIDNKIYTSKK
jgi:outer membrane protein assembly factor BamB/predicted phosphodiesterase